MQVTPSPPWIPVTVPDVQLLQGVVFSQGLSEGHGSILPQAVVGQIQLSQKYVCLENRHHTARQKNRKQNIPRTLQPSVFMPINFTGFS